MTDVKDEARGVFKNVFKQGENIAGELSSTYKKYKGLRDQVNNHRINLLVQGLEASPSSEGLEKKLLTLETTDPESIRKITERFLNDDEGEKYWAYGAVLAGRARGDLSEVELIPYLKLTQELLNEELEKLLKIGCELRSARHRDESDYEKEESWPDVIRRRMPAHDPGDPGNRLKNELVRWGFWNKASGEAAAGKPTQRFLHFYYLLSGNRLYGHEFPDDVKPI